MGDRGFHGHPHSNHLHHHRAMTSSGGSDKPPARGDTSIKSADVLCGRGKLSFNHFGNKRFRDAVTNSLSQYMKADSRYEKQVVVLGIIDMIHSEGGRFLKKDFTSGTWYELSRTQAKEKVGHAIRDAVNSFESRKKKKLQKHESNESPDASLGYSSNSWSRREWLEAPPPSAYPPPRDYSASSKSSSSSKRHRSSMLGSHHHHHHHMEHPHPHYHHMDDYSARKRRRTTSPAPALSARVPSTLKRSPILKQDHHIDVSTRMSASSMPLRSSPIEQLMPLRRSPISQTQPHPVLRSSPIMERPQRRQDDAASLDPLPALDDPIIGDDDEVSLEPIPYRYEAGHVSDSQQSPSSHTPQHGSAAYRSSASRHDAAHAARQPPASDDDHTGYWSSAMW